MGYDRICPWRILDFRGSQGALLEVQLGLEEVVSLVERVLMTVKSQIRVLWEVCNTTSPFVSWEVRRLKSLALRSSMITGLTIPIYSSISYNYNLYSVFRIACRSSRSSRYEPVCHTLGYPLGVWHQTTNRVSQWPGSYPINSTLYRLSFNPITFAITESCSSSMAPPLLKATREDSDNHSSAKVGNGRGQPLKLHSE